MSVDNRTSNQTSALKRKKMFLAQVEWLPVTSRSHTVTDKCKISIMMMIGASLSEPHIDELNVRNLYIYGGGGTSVTRAPPYTLYAVRDIFRRPHEETSALSGTTCTIIAESAK